MAAVAARPDDDDDDDDKDATTDVRRIELVERAQETLREYVPDATLRHELPLQHAAEAPVPTGVLVMESPTCGMLTCRYEQGASELSVTEPEYASVWWYVAATVLRDARELRFRDAVAPEELRLRDTAFKGDVERTARLIRRDARAAQLASTVAEQALVIQALLTRIGTLEDSVRVCETRINMMQFGEERVDETPDLLPKGAEAPAPPPLLRLLLTPSASHESESLDGDFDLDEAEDDDDDSDEEDGDESDDEKSK